jgi:DNA-binding NarL/FixJ family response regulator
LRDVTEIVGRDRELERVGTFVMDGSEAGGLVIRGEAGVGKTTLWRHGVEAARAGGHTVLLSQPLELDMAIPFAGLNDLLGGVLEEMLEVLPEPQRRALDVALLRADPVGAPPEPAAIAFALLTALKALASRASVLIAIDDMQWLDQPSQVALRFAAHRLDSTSVRLLVAQREQRVGGSALGLERVFDRARLESVALGPLSPGAIQHILKAQLGAEFPRPLLLKVHATSGGNPFFALELARALVRHGASVEPGRPLPVPETLSALVRERLTGLPQSAQRGLEVAALVSEPTIDLVREAADGDVEVAPAVGAEVIELDRERIRFTHPLLASEVAARMGEERRQAMHRRLAELVADPPERARHTALGARGQDPSAASALEQAATVALARGAPVAAAELLEHALLHTPEAAVTDRTRRLLATAEASHLAGDPERALALARQALLLAPPGQERARALLQIGEIASAIPELERALEQASDDRRLRARVRIQLSESCFGRDLVEALRHARAAAADARAADDDALLAQALAMQSWYEGATITGDPDQTAALAARLEQHARLDVKLDFTSTFTRATFSMWHDQHERARHGFELLRGQAARRGDVQEQAHALLNLAQVDWRAGDWAYAAGHIEQAESLWPRGDPSARALSLWVGAVLASHRGELDEATAAAEQGLAVAGEHLIARARNLWVIGFTALCTGHHDQALARLEQAASLFDTVGALEPGMRLFAPDLLDAYLATGRVDQADALAAELLRVGTQLGRPRASVIGGRGKGLVLAARDEPQQALDALTVAASIAERWPVPLERGRTLLALGTIQRRARRRRDARATLTEALKIFEQLGAPVFARRAQAELDRIAGRTPSGQELTPAEQRIAELVAQGLTNREVAKELVIAAHTVETALTRIYHKLGLRSRTELANRLAGGADQGDE